MENPGRIALLAVAFCFAAVTLSFVADRRVAADVPAKNVSPAPPPVILQVQDVDNPGLHPFAITTSCTGQCAASWTLPSTTSTGGAVKTVVIDFMSAFCTGLATGITADNFNMGYFLGGQSNEIFFPAVVDNAQIGRVTMQTAIYADPGSSGNLGTPGSNSGCSASLTGHLVLQ
jgi:hypothetical protein